MADDTVLNLITRVDVGPLKAGMADAAASVQSGAASIAAALIADGESAEAAASGLKNLGYSASEAKAAVDSLNSSVAMNAVVEETAARAVRSGISERMAASAAMRVLEGNMMGSTRAAGAFLTTTLGLGPALQAAFPIIGAVALLEILGRLGSKIEEIAEKPDKISMEWEKLSTSVVEENDRLSNSYDKVLIKVTELQSGKLAGLDLAIKLLGQDSSSLAPKIESITAAMAKILIEERSWGEDLEHFSIMLGTVLDNITIFPSRMASLTGALSDLKAHFQDTAGEAKVFGESLANTVATEGTVRGLERIDAELNTVYTDLQKKPSDEALQHFRDQLEGMQKMLSREANTTYMEGVERSLQRDKEAAAEFEKQMQIVQKSLDALTKSTGETFNPKGQAQTAGVGSEGTDIAKLTADQNDQMSKFLNERLSLELKTAEAGATADKKAAEESIDAAIKTEEGYEASLRGQEKTAEDSYSRQIDQLKRMAQQGQLSRSNEAAQVVALYQQEEATVQASLDKQIDAAIMTAQLEAAKRGEILSAADAAELAAVQRLEQEKLSIHQEFLKKQQDAEDQAEKQMEATLDRYVNTFDASLSKVLENAITGNRQLGESIAKMFTSVMMDGMKAAEAPLKKELERQMADMLHSKIGGGLTAGIPSPPAAAPPPAAAAPPLQPPGVSEATTTSIFGAGGPAASSTAQIAPLTTAGTTLTTAGTTLETSAVTLQTGSTTLQTASLTLQEAAMSLLTAAGGGGAAAAGGGAAAGGAGAFADLLAFDEGGAVPRTGMAMLHENERVASGDMWDEIAKMKQGGESSSNLTLNYHDRRSMSAVDTHGLHDLLARDPSAAGKLFGSLMRSGGFDLQKAAQQNGF